ncbi:MAG TPA: MBL fold metallo-hydrolase [Cytophagales bacterium]|nr:MBL fold metallo-hydrolase [Cytophagales bacterium]
MEEIKRNIDAETLREWLEEKENVIVVDVRPQEQRDEWYIPGSKYVDAYKGLSKGDSSILDDLEIPENTKVVAVCAAGRTSQIASDVLRKRGIDSYSLEGGMKSWSLAWNTAELNFGELTILQIRRTGKGCLSYIIASKGEAIVIDASINAAVYIEIAKKRNWKVKYVVDTHMHADHLSRALVLAKQTDTSIYLPENDNLQFDYNKIIDEDQIAFGTSYLKAIHTPGHTLDSTCYLVDEKYLFTGDTIFIDGVGRPDLKANEEQAKVRASLLYDSLHKILKLKNDTFIFPGHISKPIPFDDKPIAGKLGDIQEEVSSLKLSKEHFVANILAKIPPTPLNYLRVSEINAIGNFEGIDPKELEAGANRCAIP